MLEEKYKKLLFEMGMDVNNPSYPLGKEYLNILQLKNDIYLQCIDHLITLLLLDMLLIKKYNVDDFEYYLKKLKIKTISFWGERFEIYFYARLIQKSYENSFSVRRTTKYEEPDFVIENELGLTYIEATSLNYEENTLRTNPIRKINKKINEKQLKPYANENTCLVIDLTNLLFYRPILDNFSKSITEYIDDLESNFGAILFHQTYHTIENDLPYFYSNAYDWRNPNISSKTNGLLRSILGGPQTPPSKKIQFRIS